MTTFITSSAPSFVAYNAESISKVWVSTQLSNLTGVAPKFKVIMSFEGYHVDLIEVDDLDSANRFAAAIVKKVADLSISGGIIDLQELKTFVFRDRSKDAA